MIGRGHVGSSAGMTIIAPSDLAPVVDFFPSPLKQDELPAEDMLAVVYSVSAAKETYTVGAFFTHRSEWEHSTTDTAILQAD